MADAGGQEILVIARMAQQEHPRSFDQGTVRAQVEIEIAAHPATGKDTDPALEGFRRMPGRFQRLPGGFQEMAVLRIKDRGFLGGKAEELCVETIKTFERRCERHIGGVLQHGRAFAGGDQLFLRQAADGRAPFAQVFPIATDVRCARKMRRHPDDGDVGFTRIHINLLIVPKCLQGSAGITLKTG